MALELWDQTLKNVFWENAFFFELWKGAIDHKTAMKLRPFERDLYLRIGEAVARLRKDKNDTGDIDN